MQAIGHYPIVVVDPDGEFQGYMEAKDPKPARVLAAAAGLAMPSWFVDRAARDPEHYGDFELGEWEEIVSPNDFVLPYDYWGSPQTGLKLVLVPTTKPWEASAWLAFGGRNPVTGKQVMDAAKVPGVLAVMATAGLYDDSGKWLYQTGLPAKSGVGGGLIAVSPGKFGIAVVSPPLDDAGNSVRAQRAIADISNALGGNPYAVARK